ncbi:hypothetical protein SAMN05443144_1338 [Fodinibius roseus]|uniref:Uncharacterized protein n=1 Tax=Fodinibius roseus TaxID=1194090 RepID=A0A1M5KMU9_9BACT|nr:hypothetical protein [Fodinibius roseus]SHG54010.1 hypothetical protein SAMN05443144_1338 [Fodinibius roseus]
MFGYKTAEFLTTINDRNRRDWATSTQSFCLDVTHELAMSYSKDHYFFQVLDLSNAFLRGKTCVKYRLTTEKPYSFSTIIGDNGSLQNVFEKLEALDPGTYEQGQELSSYLLGKPDVSLTAYRRERKAIRVFSPLHLDHVKPLQKEPKKWNVRLAMRALINGQFSTLKCNGKYSDDYAYDAAVNYHQGTIADHIYFAAKIIEDPSGWRVYRDRDNKKKVHLNCHHFDTNEFIFQLEPTGTIEQ